MLPAQTKRLTSSIVLAFGVLLALIIVIGANSTVHASVSTAPTTQFDCDPQVIATLYFSDNTPMFVTVNPATGYAYVSSQFENKVFVLRGTEIVTTITSIAHTYRIAANPATGYVYLSADTVYVLSATEVITTISVFPGEIAINPVTDYVYIAENGASTAVVSGTQVITSIPAKSGVFGVDTGSGRIYSSWIKDWPGEIYVISGTKILGSVPATAGGFRAISANPRTGYAYISYQEEPLVEVLSGTESLTAFPTGLGPWQSASDPLSGYVYVPNTNSDTVTVISGTKIIASIPTDRYPYDVAINPNSGCVYVRNLLSNTLTILSGTQKIGTIPLGIGTSTLMHKPDVAGTMSEMAIDPVTGLLYVADGANRRISIIAEQPIIRFDATPLTGISPLVVTFTNQSRNDFTVTMWDFGDGITSTELNPAHTYRVSGNFTVTMTISNPTISTTLARTNYITVYQPVSAAFNAVPSSGTAPLTVAFTNQSTGNFIDTHWDFGDGIISMLNDPTHIYEAGSYTVSLQIFGLGGTDIYTRTNYINVSAPRWQIYLPVIQKLS